jgi:hypothetical protein
MCYWLEDRGIQPTLKIGVRLERDNRLDAHAWVEYGGGVINDSPAVKTVFSAFPAGASPARLKFRRS